MRIGRYGSSTGFTDLLFNIVVGLAFMFVLAFILINPITKKHDVEEKSDYLIILTWDDKSKDDIDIWVQDPLSNIVSFRNRGTGFMHLDRDDLGTRNDVIYLPDGTTKIIERNREVVSLRGTVEGEYLVNAHIYDTTSIENDYIDGKKYPKKLDINIKVELIQVNPYKLVTFTKMLGKHRGQEFTAFRFTLDAKGKITKVSNERKSIIATRTYGDVSGGQATEQAKIFWGEAW